MKRRELFRVVRYDSVIGKREVENDLILRDRRASVWNAFDHGRRKNVASILIISAIGRLLCVFLSKISRRLRRDSKLQFAGRRRRFLMPLFRLSFFVKQLRAILPWNFNNLRPRFTRRCKAIAALCRVTTSPLPRKLFTNSNFVWLSIYVAECLYLVRVERSNK